jgi:hypothetical protein
MGTHASGNIIIEFDSAYKTERILASGIDIMNIILQLTSTPLVGRTVALPEPLYKLANQVFDAIDDVNRQGLNGFIAITAADRFFESFVPLWRSLFSFGFQLACSEMWAQLLRWTLSWESSHSAHIHKGTPFFFLGENLIFQGDIDTAFLFIYNAMEEDKAWSSDLNRSDQYKQAPAYMTATIADDQRNALYHTIVKPIRKAIADYATSFSSATSTSFTLADFQANFLDKAELEEVILFFVYNMYHHVQRNRFNQVPRFFDNDFTKLKNLDSIFNLCLVIEEVLQHKFAGTAANYYISDGILHLASGMGWIPAGESERRFFAKLQGVDLRLDPSTTVPTLLTGNITYDNRPIRSELLYLLLAWHLRNYGGHNIRAQTILVQSYDQIFEWLMYALFVAVK